MDAASLLRVVGRLEQHGIDVWIDGGWGVDALLERQTREHDDLDLVAELGCSGSIIELLHGLGYDLVAAGGGVYQMDEGRSWVYPGEGFAGRGSVAGRQVRCLSPEVQVLVHAGYELTEKDYRELYLLRERFGVELPGDLLERVLALAPPG